MRGLHRTTVEVSEHYRAIEDAAAANCPRCVAWIIAHNNNNDDDDGGAGAEPEAGGSRSRRRRRKAKEQIAVVTGLCRGGHLGTVKAFVGSRGACECWVVREGEGLGAGRERNITDELEFRGHNNQHGNGTNFK
ncbi:hypothetical protein Pelo_5850 [Pelomyxa schiedti]|nr:hypothetical protein Pelo_5850 [Pelomyxa schiedti]